MTGAENYEKEIALSLSQLAKLQAYAIIQSDAWQNKSNGEKIYFLNQVGFLPDDIALLVDTTIGTVRKEISIRRNKAFCIPVARR